MVACSSVYSWTQLKRRKIFLNFLPNFNLKYKNKLRGNFSLFQWINSERSKRKKRKRKINQKNRKIEIPNISRDKKETKKKKAVIKKETNSFSISSFNTKIRESTCFGRPKLRTPNASISWFFESQKCKRQKMCFIRFICSTRLWTKLIKILSIR